MTDPAGQTTLSQKATSIQEAVSLCVCKEQEKKEGQTGPLQRRTLAKFHTLGKFFKTKIIFCVQLKKCQYHSSKRGSLSGLRCYVQIWLCLGTWLLTSRSLMRPSFFRSSFTGASLSGSPCQLRRTQDKARKPLRMQQSNVRDKKQTANNPCLRAQKGGIQTRKMGHRCWGRLLSAE